MPFPKASEGYTPDYEFRTVPLPRTIALQVMVIGFRWGSLNAARKKTATH